MIRIFGRRRTPRVRSGPLAIALLLGAILLPACVEREMVVRSDPPGGVVLVDNKVVGVTPYRTPFTHYGERLVEVRWDPFLQQLDPGLFAFETAKESRSLRAPIYQWFPLDFIFELCMPFTLRDEHVFDFKLQPIDRAAARTDDRLNALIGRAEAMRADTLRGGEDNR